MSPNHKEIQSSLSKILNDLILMSTTVIRKSALYLQDLQSFDDASAECVMQNIEEVLKCVSTDLQGYGSSLQNARRQLFHRENICIDIDNSRQDHECKLEDEPCIKRENSSPILDQLKDSISEVTGCENSISFMDVQTSDKSELCDYKPDENFNEDSNSDSDDVAHSFLPKKSRSLYKKTFKKFEDWCQKYNVESISETVLLTYFQEQMNMYKASTLWAIYSMLKSCLSNQRNVDISKYYKVQSLLKDFSKDHVSKKSNIFEEEDINRFIAEADDYSYLAMKTILIIGYTGACKREEITYLSLDNIEFKPDSIVVTVPKSRKKTSKGIFVIKNQQWIDIVKKYARLRPRNVTHRRFFLTYRRGRCVNTPIGINIMAKIPRNIATFLQLPNPELYTGHCFRRSATTHLGNFITLKCPEERNYSALVEGFPDQLQ